MNPSAAFLTAMAQALATTNLYGEGHPARERAARRAHERLAALQEGDARRVFTFLGDEVVEGARPIAELHGWDWTGRFAAAGLQRLEFLDVVAFEDLEAFLEEMAVHLSGETIPSAQVRQGRPSNIRYGEVAVRGREETVEEASRQLATATLDYSLAEEIEGIEWLQNELRAGRQLHLLEADTIVRSLSVAMHGDQAFLLPMLRLKEYDQYTVTHTLNVAVLSMALAEFLGLGPKEVRSFGVAGLLHDMGKIRIPHDILNKPGKLTPEEREVMNSHPAEGARLILASEEHLDMAAVVAYEHHIRIDGGGYPSLHYERACHDASNLVHVCDVFDALRTDRPYREAWPTEKALRIIEEGAGPEFDRDMALAFVQMMRRWEGRVAEVTPDEAEVELHVSVDPAREGEGVVQADEGAERGEGQVAKEEAES
ncbi:MAG: HD-GYP domain-containing protein [Gemmatimonadota bacterium]